MVINKMHCSHKKRSVFLKKLTARLDQMCNAPNQYIQSNAVVLHKYQREFLYRIIDY